jgi:hypothetical protein
MRVAVYSVAVLIGTLLTMRVAWSLGYFGDVTQANFDRIELGMSRKEVYRILGCPPGDYRSGDRTWVRVTSCLCVGESCNWHVDEGSYLVHISPDNRVICKKPFQQSE